MKLLYNKICTNTLYRTINILYTKLKFPLLSAHLSYLHSLSLKTVHSRTSFSV